MKMNAYGFLSLMAATFVAVNPVIAAPTGTNINCGVRSSVAVCLYDD